MKLRTTVLALTTLLLASLASAEPVKPSDQAQAPVMAPAVSSSCDAAGSVAKLPFESPTALPASPTCGSCSDQWCAGLMVGEYCTYLTRFGYQAGACQITNGVCSNGVGFQCGCAGGINPYN